MNRPHKYISTDMTDHIHQSNLIEEIDDRVEDKQSLEAWQFLREQSEITIGVLLDLHFLITKNQLGDQAGKFRMINVMVGGHTCPEPFLAQQLIHNWLYALKTFHATVEPIEMHVKFEKIHPFIDGNGRTGRMLLWWHEIRLGEKPTLFLNDEKHEKYYKLFREDQ